jgi:hypothetical protein
MKPAGRFDLYVERATGSTDWSYCVACPAGFNSGLDPKTSSSGGARISDLRHWGYACRRPTFGGHGDPHPALLRRERLLLHSRGRSADGSSGSWGLVVGLCGARDRAGAGRGARRCRGPGCRILRALCSAVWLYLGVVAALVLPHHPGSWGHIGGGHFWSESVSESPPGAAPNAK